LPLTLQGARDPLPITYRTPGGVRPDQVRRCCWRGWPRPPSLTVIETEASRDHTELMLKHFGAEIVSGRRQPRPQDLAHRQPELHGADVVVPADPVSAAFPIVAALIVDGSDIVLSDVMTNPLRTACIGDICARWRASIGQSGLRGDAASRWRVPCTRLKLRGVDVPPERAPSMIGRISGAGGRSFIRRRHHDHARPANCASRNPIASPPPPTCSASMASGWRFQATT